MVYKESGKAKSVQPSLSIPTSTRLFPRQLTLRTYLQQLPVSFAIWTAIVILKGGQVLMNDATHQYVLPLRHYFVWAGLDLYSWAFFTPLIIALSFRFPI